MLQELESCAIRKHLCWITNVKVVVWPQPNAHFCDRCDPFVKITNVKVVVWPQPNAHFCDFVVKPSLAFIILKA